MKIETLAQKRTAIALLMEYAVPEEHRQEAMALLDKYAGDRVALNLLHEFYSFLPDAADDAVLSLRLLARRQGLYLFWAVTAEADYFYLSSPEETTFLGRLSEGIWDADVLAFFGITDREAFQNALGSPEDFPSYEPASADLSRCPACAVVEGEYHVLGCPVETCPWCGGQLTRCNCRFEQLDAEEIDSEDQVELLRQKIGEAGRIPFTAAKERPDFRTSPTSSPPFSNNRIDRNPRR